MLQVWILDEKCPSRTIYIFLFSVLTLSICIYYYVQSTSCLKSHPKDNVVYSTFVEPLLYYKHLGHKSDNLWRQGQHIKHRCLLLQFFKKGCYHMDELQKVSIGNIVRFLGHSTSTNPLQLVFEPLPPNGCRLLTRLREVNNRVNLKQVTSVIERLANCLQYLVGLSMFYDSLIFLIVIPRYL